MKIKKRRQMTPEQKKAAGERLAKARAARQASNPPQYKNVHASVLALSEDNPFNMKKVRGWIKTQKELLSEHRKALRQKVKGAEARVSNTEAYIRNLERYLREGIYVDMFYGEHGQNNIKYRCVVPSYDKNGEPKRSYGVFYQDLGYVYGITET